MTTLFRRSALRLARRKHGQRAWSPNASSAGAAPGNGVTAQEALQIAYRPMPPDQTVEHEEDFGPSLIIHREFISRKHRERMSFQMSALAFSELELERARARLAGDMNRERTGVLIGPGAEEADRVHMNTDVDDDTREIRSARFLFNETRMRYCDRFQEHIRDTLERCGLAPPGGGRDDDNILFSLMEACAVVFGCETPGAREAHYSQFLGLDMETLEGAEDALAQRRVEMRRLARHLEDTPAGAGVGGHGQGREEGGDPVQRLIDSMPSLMESNNNSTQQQEQLPGRTESSAPPPRVEDVEGLEGFAPLVRSHLEHASGRSATVSYDVEPTLEAEVLATRRRWRTLMDTLVAERFEELTAADLREAHVLNEQLHTIKFFDLKVGDTVREIVQLSQRETGDGSSQNRDTPLGVSPRHPERRV